MWDAKQYVLKISWIIRDSVEEGLIMSITCVCKRLITIAKSLVLHNWVEHILLYNHFIQEFILNEKVKMQYHASMAKRVDLLMDFLGPKLIYKLLWSSEVLKYYQMEKIEMHDVELTQLDDVVICNRMM